MRALGEDGNYGRFSIGAERMKNMTSSPDWADNGSFDIPMSQQMAGLLKTAIEEHGNQTHVFGSKRILNGSGRYEIPNTGPLNDRHADKKIKQYREGYGIINKCNHDMRRTMETTLGNLFYPDDIVSLMTSHKRQGMSGVYNHSQKVRLLRRCYQYWSDFIDFICANDEQYAISFDEDLENKYSNELIQRFSYSPLLAEMHKGLVLDTAQAPPALAP